MGQTILTPKQSDFLELVRKEKFITDNFYLTGGTALTEFYLKHRLSEDIDLFIEKREVEADKVDVFLKKIGHSLGVSAIKRSQFLGLFSYKLLYKDTASLKVDFNYYPFPRISKGLTINNLDIDSIYDIAANKIHTLFMKPRARDYVDIYFILREKNYSLKKIILNAKAKFDWHIDPANLGNQFTRVIEISDLPKMLVPFDKKEMDQFFLKLAKSLDNEIFE
ncbi:hypothetical protein A3D78_06965 [Candidatus Gottesmanbacteria bacterium RIFCSPHIGHO2_02_FULL_39_14]|uniref:Nucleotidyl transferase AbiEii/AbiGii toxin family protein n=2 Tax=Candidatus Gottesmaniibacteriota TaxID=1752720 RepID=A0A1F5ZU86_9BACT|nr:MAG: hypothetical protein A3D78_06965 [Candidatus Gottesmanbacteria bacterium RIFCSPHIGHO2_02_FULL_39_14]OGG32382.1 MAG: hypothetical protein A3I51_00875 [Candidatus Gottesmanbacteria bacterium RIFCSPLOWO2_02_FULL_38_8]